MNKFYFRKTLLSVMICFLLLSGSLVSSSYGKDGVLVLAAVDSTWLADVRNKIDSTSLFSRVDAFNVTDSLPSLSLLNTYDAVIVYDDNSFLDPEVIGDTLAAYIDAGGGVVDAVFENASMPVEGAFNSEKYRVLMSDSQTEGEERVLDSVLIPDHPLMAGIDSFSAGTASYISTSSELAPGAYRVANYDNGDILVAARDRVGLLRVPRVSLNFYPSSSDVRNDFWKSNTDGAKLMANALEYVSSYISGDKDTFLIGNSISLTFHGSNGSKIIKWQKKYINDSWTDMNNTNSAMNITPDKLGNWFYRVVYTKNDHTWTSCSFNAFVNVNQTITFNSLPVKLLGDSSFKLNAEASSGLKISFSSSDTSVAEIINDTVYIKAIGNTIITASQEGKDSILPSADVSRILKIRKPSQDISVNITSFDLARDYDGTSDFDVEYNAPDTLDVVLTYNGSDIKPKDAGVYEVIAAIDDSVLYAADTVYYTINKINLFVTADNKTKAFNSNNPEFTLSYSGFVNNETSDVLDVKPIASCIADNFSPIGDYPIVVGGGSDNNYNYSYTSGTLTIIPATTEINNAVQSNVSFYPNPVMDILTIKNLDNSAVELKILDLSGRLLINTKLQAETINVSNLPAGIYTISINNQVSKLIKK